MNGLATMPAITFRAWLVSRDCLQNDARPVDLPYWAETPENAAIAAGGYRKDSVLVLRTDASKRPEQRHTLHVYVIRQKAAIWTKDGRVTPLYPELQSKFYVADGFSPIEPFDAFRDCPVGNDKTLVASKGRA